MTNINEKLKKAWDTTLEKFPFKGYINPDRQSGYFDMVKIIESCTGTDVEVLDFGAGPCDKTAMFSLAGMKVTAFDTLEDTWHKMDNNREKIVEFSEAVGIRYLQPENKTGSNPLPFMEEDKMYDVIMSHDVLEHFHSSPRILLNTALQKLKPGGHLAITVPNAANLRKRIHLLFGKTNYNRYDYFYWYPGFWNGHVREYVKGDLEKMAEFLGMDIVKLTSYHLQLDVLPRYLRPFYKFFTIFAPGVRDSWMLVCKKPENWEPKFEPSEKVFKEALGWHYFDLTQYEFDWESES